MLVKTVVCSLVSAIVIFGMPAVAAATNFGIVTTVYDATEEESPPLNETTTLFRNGVVYNFQPSASRITIFRDRVAGSHGRFVLLDTAREVRSEVSTEQIASVMTKLRKWSATQKDPFLKFTGNPIFQETFEPETGELSLTSEHLSYRVQTVPLDHPEVNSEMKAFLDGFAQLHTLLEAGLPPQPRLRLNEALSRRELLPVSVELSGDEDDRPSLRAEHSVTWRLSKRDQIRIDDANDRLASYREVSNQEFHHGVNSVPKTASK